MCVVRSRDVRRLRRGGRRRPPRRGPPGPPGDAGRDPPPPRGAPARAGAPAPRAATGGGQRSLLPTDLRAQSMVGKIFSCKLVLGSANEDTRFEYLVTFKIASTYREE